MVRHQNQIHPPTKKESRVDKLGNDRRKVYHKAGYATMLLFNNVTENGAKALINNMQNLAEKLGVKIEGSFIICR